MEGMPNGKWLPHMKQIKIHHIVAEIEVEAYWAAANVMVVNLFMAYYRIKMQNLKSAFGWCEPTELDTLEDGGTILKTYE